MRLLAPYVNESCEMQKLRYQIKSHSEWMNKCLEFKIRFFYVYPAFSWAVARLYNRSDSISHHFIAS